MNSRYAIFLAIGLSKALGLIRDLFLMDQLGMNEFTDIYLVTGGLALGLPAFISLSVKRNTLSDLNGLSRQEQFKIINPLFRLAIIPYILLILLLLVDEGLATDIFVPGLSRQPELFWLLILNLLGGILMSVNTVYSVMTDVSEKTQSYYIRLAINNILQLIGLVLFVIHKNPSIIYFSIILGPIVIAYSWFVDRRFWEKSTFSGGVLSRIMIGSMFMFILEGIKLIDRNIAGLYKSGLASELILANRFVLAFYGMLIVPLFVPRIAHLSATKDLGDFEVGVSRTFRHLFFLGLSAALLTKVFELGGSLSSLMSIYLLGLAGYAVFNILFLFYSAKGRIVELRVVFVFMLIIKVVVWCMKDNLELLLPISTVLMFTISSIYMLKKMRYE